MKKYAISKGVAIAVGLALGSVAYAWNEGGTANPTACYWRDALARSEGCSAPLLRPDWQYVFSVENLMEMGALALGAPADLEIGDLSALGGVFRLRIQCITVRSPDVYEESGWNDWPVNARPCGDSARRSTACCPTDSWRCRTACSCTSTP